SQRKAIDRVYAQIASGSAAQTFVSEYYRGDPPFKRAETETVSVEVKSVLPKGLVRVPGHIHDPEFRLQAQQPLDEIGTAHPGQDHIGQYQLDCVSAVMVHLECFFRTLSHQDCVAKLLEDVMGQFADHSFIL